MKKFLRFTCLLLACLSLFGITACGKQQNSKPQPTTGAKDASWEAILKRGKLHVALIADDVVCVPESSKNPPDFATALINQIAERLGITPEFQILSAEQAKKNIEAGSADLTFSVKDESMGCSQTVLKIDQSDYCLIYRKNDQEFSLLLDLTLQNMANDGLISQLSIEYLEQDYSTIASQIDTGQPSEEEAEEYDARLKENN